MGLGTPQPDGGCGSKTDEHGEHTRNTPHGEMPRQIAVQQHQTPHPSCLSWPWGLGPHNNQNALGRVQLNIEIKINTKFIHAKFNYHKIFLIKLDTILNINIIPSQKLYLYSNKIKYGYG